VTASRWTNVFGQFELCHTSLGLPGAAEDDTRQRKLFGYWRGFSLVASAASKTKKCSVSVVYEVGLDKIMIRPGQDRVHASWFILRKRVLEYEVQS